MSTVNQSVLLDFALLMLGEPLTTRAGGGVPGLPRDVWIMKQEVERGHANDETSHLTLSLPGSTLSACYPAVPNGKAQECPCAQIQLHSHNKININRQISIIVELDGGLTVRPWPSISGH